MQAVFNHIETIKLKPHRVRKQIAFLYAAIVAGIIAVLWLGVNVSTGAFAIRDAGNSDIGAAAVTAEPASSGLAGVAGAGAQDSGQGRIEIVDTTPKPSPKPEPTVIPF